MKRFLIGIAILTSVNYATSAQQIVTLYEDCNYRGRSFFLEPGTYRMFQMKIGNDRLSSLQVPYGMRVTLYEHDEFKGRSKTLTASVTCLDDSFNDQTSSLVVENTLPQYAGNDYIVFYNDCNQKGYSRSLGPGTYTGTQLGSLRNNISSFQIYGNLRLRVYTGSDDAMGYYQTLEEAISCLGGNLNDRIRSLVIEYRSNFNQPGGDPGGFATIYSDCNYRGNSFRLMRGSYTGEKLGLLRYNIASIELPSNLQARAYVNSENLSGVNYIISETSSCLGSSLNRRIASLVIEDRFSGGANPSGGNTDRVILYTDANFLGQAAILLPGNYARMSDVGFPDKALSSLTVPAGFRVVLYESENFKGRQYTIISTRSSFTFTGWNDRTSSISVFRDR
ncbi:MAG: hypothetical protein RJA57_642 [Bacteroidota bacterium]|jgi:hypothetical protein